MIRPEGGSEKEREKNAGDHGDLTGSCVFLFGLRSFSAHASTTTRGAQDVEGETEVGCVGGKIRCDRKDKL